MKIIKTLTLIGIGLAIAAPLTQAQTPEELAKESEAAAVASASTKPTPDMIKNKVTEACKLFEKEGLAALPKLQGKDSNFIFAGTYIWVHDMEGNMVMHPIKPKLNGKPIIGLKDSDGKMFFLAMNDLVKKQGEGWISYMWPKPGEKAPSPKVSFVKGVETSDGKHLVLGCGSYDLSPSEVGAQ